MMNNNIDWNTLANMRHDVIELCDSNMWEIAVNKVNAEAARCGVIIENIPAFICEHRWQEFVLPDPFIAEIDRQNETISHE